MTKPARIKRGPSVLAQVIDALRFEVRGIEQPGAKLDSISALARRFGVSYNTVLSALTLLQQEGLVELRHGSGTYVRERPTPAKHVALLAEIDLFDPTVSYFFREMFRRLRGQLMVAGHDVRLYSGTTIPGSGAHSADIHYSTVAGRHLVEDLDAVNAVAAFLMLADEPWIAPVRARGIPIISNLPELGPAVGADRADLVSKAVGALARGGCRRVALVNWGSLKPLANAAEDHTLADAFTRCCAELGLQTKPAWTVSVTQPGVPSAAWEAFRDIWRAAPGKPDGLVVTDDQLLPGVFDALRDCGVHGTEQVRIATHFTEGLPLALPPGVIKVEFSPARYAGAMADLVLGALRGAPAPAQPVLVPHRAVGLESTDEILEPTDSLRLR